MVKIIGFVLCVLLFSCEKQDLYCWECLTYSGGAVVSKIVTCGMPESDIMDFQIGIESGISSVTKLPAETVCTKRK